MGVFYSMSIAYGYVTLFVSPFLLMSNELLVKKMCFVTYTNRIFSDFIISIFAFKVSFLLCVFNAYSREEISIKVYNRTSMARTLMAHLPGLFQTHS